MLLVFTIQHSEVTCVQPCTLGRKVNCHLFDPTLTPVLPLPKPEGTLLVGVITFCTQSYAPRVITYQALLVQFAALHCRRGGKDSAEEGATDGQKGSASLSGSNREEEGGSSAEKPALKMR